MDGRQQSWPRIWLMSDERMGDQLWEAIDRLPEGAGIVLRHYSLPAEARKELAERVAEAADRRGFMLSIARDAQLAQHVGAKLVHNPARRDPARPFSATVHDMSEAEAANSAGAALVFVSPVYATRSHPGREPLGPELASKLARAAAVPAIALGGMDAQRFARLEREDFYGWAGIDAWLRT